MNRWFYSVNYLNRSLFVTYFGKRLINNKHKRACVKKRSLFLKISFTLLLILFLVTASLKLFLDTTIRRSPLPSSTKKILKFLELWKCFGSEEVRKFYAVKTLRPFFLLLDSIALPALVAILALKPWLLLLFKVLGWNVLFIIYYLQKIVANYSP